ncbi:sensor histidine kinase [Paludisphaera rhizosphaerae]|uniref:sensor histidine kinase n=1 Tax=Paludisphaera rhizosphaerae TaxID=2711216 RepID=UPI0013E9E0EC|nr:HAMP domain-containing sensor histidine kinase [Paludisphaera rhizosphaerae]
MNLKLGTRLTIYYVTAIAVVLVGFSIALYLLASKHLNRQAYERLEAALNTLSAAAEIEPDGVTWEPEERSLTFGRRTLEGPLVWRVADERGTRIDGSSTDEPDRKLSRLGVDEGADRRFATFADDSGATWLAMSRRLGRPPTAAAEAPLASPEEGRHEALILSVASSMEGVRSNLRNLALTLAGLSLAVWTVCLTTGRRLCRAALQPLTDMAAAAGAIEGDEPGRRLPIPAADDELAELGRTFNALLDRLGESLERQQRFTGDASHQLRTPLTSVQGQVDLALRQDRSPEEYRRVLTLVQSRTRHLRQIVEGLMFLSRADAEARRPALEEVAIDDWLKAHLDAWPGRGRVEVVHDEEPSSTPCLVHVHGPLLGELLNNLLDNAAKYGPPGSPIQVRLSRRDATVAISVSDEGPGIEPAEIARLFEPFYRTESARLKGAPGVGLGLSVAARIAAVFGGRITVENAAGRGATFTVHLPISERPTSEIVRPEPDSVPAR